MTSPYPSTITDVLRAPQVTHRAWITAQRMTGGQAVSVPLTDGRLSADETRRPRFTLDATSAPLGPLALSVLSPKVGVWIDVYAGYLTPTGWVDARLVRLVLVHRRTVIDGDQGASVTLTAESVEAMIDGEPLKWQMIPSGAPSQMTIAAYLAWLSSTGSRYTDLPVRQTSTVATVPHQYLPRDGITVPELLDELCADASAEWFGDPSGTILIRPRPESTDSAAVSLGGDDTALLSWDETDALDEWANGAHIIYRYTDFDGNAWEEHHAAVHGASPFYQWRQFEREHSPGDIDFITYETDLVARTSRRGAELYLSTPAVWWLTPGDVVRATSPDWTVYRRAVQAVDHDLVAGLSSITLRPDFTEVTMIRDLGARRIDDLTEQIDDI